MRLLLPVLVSGCVDVERPRRSRDPNPVQSGMDATAGADVTSPMKDGSTEEMDAGEMPLPDAEPPPPPPGIGVLGNDTHSIGEVLVEEIGARGDGLNVPRALAFNTERPDELWVVNQADDSMVIFSDTGEPNQSSEKRIDPYALHFMDSPSSIAFGAPGRFATCQESRNSYDDMAPPNDFMGPTLWPSDLDVFGFSNPQAVRDLGFDLGSHLDMLHESPLCMGVAFERENVYWTFDGLSSSISRYDFLHDHGPGYDDHSDGVIERYVEGDVQRVPDVPSHLVLDRATNLLYIADTGNARIAILDTSTGRQGPSLAVMEPGTTLTQMIDASLTTLVDRVGGELDRPSGLVLHDGLLFVGDNATSRISAFDLGGVRIDYLDTGLPPGALMGLAFDRQGRMYIADALGDRVLQISDKP